MDLKQILSELVSDGWGTGEDDMLAKFGVDYGRKPSGIRGLLNSEKLFHFAACAGLTTFEVMLIIEGRSFGERFGRPWIGEPGKYVTSEHFTNWDGVPDSFIYPFSWATLEEAAETCKVTEKRVRYEYVPLIKKRFGHYAVSEEVVTHEYRWDFESPDYDWTDMAKSAQEAMKRPPSKTKGRPKGRHHSVDSYGKGVGYDRPTGYDPAHEPLERVKQTVYPMMINRQALAVIDDEYKGSKKNNGKGQPRNGGKFGKKS